MKRFFFITLILFSYSACRAQYLAAFNDNLNQFWAFEAGMFNQLEEVSKTNRLNLLHLNRYFMKLRTFKLVEL